MNPLAASLTPFLGIPLSLRTCLSGLVEQTGGPGLSHLSLVELYLALRADRFLEHKANFFWAALLAIDAATPRTPPRGWLEESSRLFPTPKTVASRQCFPDSHSRFNPRSNHL